MPLLYWLSESKAIEGDGSGRIVHTQYFCNHQQNMSRDAGRDGGRRNGIPPLSVQLMHWEVAPSGDFVISLLLWGSWDRNSGEVVDEQQAKPQL